MSSERIVSTVSVKSGGSKKEILERLQGLEREFVIERKFKLSFDSLYTLLTTGELSFTLKSNSTTYVFTHELSDEEKLILSNKFIQYLVEKLGEDYIVEEKMTRKELIEFLTSEELEKIDPDGTLEIVYGKDNIEIDDFVIVQEGEDKYIKLF